MPLSNRAISFTAQQPPQAPLGGVSPARSDMLAALLKRQASPDYQSVQSPLEGFAKMLTSGIQGWEAGEVARGEEKKKADAEAAARAEKMGAAQSLADLLAPPINPDGTPNPKNKQLVGLLVGGAIAPSAFGDEVSTRLGFGKAAAPIKMGAGDTIIDPNTYVPLYTAPAAPPAPKSPTPYTDIGQINADLKAGFLSPAEAEQAAARLQQKAPDGGFTLAPGQVRYGADGKPIATAPSATKAPVIQEFFDDKTGLPYKAQLDEQSGQWVRIGGVKSDVMSPEAFQQRVDLAQAGKTSITNNIGPTGIDYGQPPKDMSWARDAQGQIILEVDPKTGYSRPRAVPIAGGPIEAAQIAADAQAAAKKTTQDTNATIVVQDIDRALANIKGSPGTTTGVGAAILQNIPGTTAYDTGQLISTIKANTGFDKLQAMRAASPTGGALGAVSERENALLQDAIGALSLPQGQPQLEDNLRRVKNIYLDIIHGPGQGPPRETLTFQQVPAGPGTQPGAPGGPVDYRTYFGGQ